VTWPDEASYVNGPTPTIEAVDAAAYRFPTPQPEADGTLTWDATVAVTATIRAGGQCGLGWTYSSEVTANVITAHLAPCLEGRDAFDIAGGWTAMHRAGRNLGTRGLYMHALSAVDIAWWDLKARLLGKPLNDLLGRCRDAVPVYGSGGFTNLTDRQLADQVEAWSAAGCTAMKIKIGEGWGTSARRDLARTRRLRGLAGPGIDLMVDANGGYRRAQAQRVGHDLDELGVTWFEEPVSSDDVEALAAVRDEVRCDVAAGEYVYDQFDVNRLLPVVDCLQLDATRCGGYTGWLRGASSAQARNLKVSAHCAPALHVSVAAAVPNTRHIEWFVDHARLEPQLVADAPEVRAGEARVNRTAPGHGMTVNPAADARRVR
jgi:L-alanine-DL-glutamate epimerase-like enolase superfamily enzyme